MSFDPFEAAIQALPPEELASLGEQIEAQITTLRGQRESVRRALTRKSHGAGTTARPQRKRKAGSAVEQRRQLIKRLVESGEREQWLPMHLEGAFANEGDPVSRDYLRTLARRMVTDGEIGRHPSGNGFMPLPKLASANGSAKESLGEAKT
jgi:hypothetical protein